MSINLLATSSGDAFIYFINEEIVLCPDSDIITKASTPNRYRLVQNDLLAVCVVRRYSILAPVPGTLIIVISTVTENLVHDLVHFLHEKLILELKYYVTQT